MSWSGAADRTGRSVRVVWLLIGSFVLTVACFIAATSVAEYRARGIGADADSIANNALPSIACLSQARTEVHQLAMLLERLASEASPQTASGMADARASRDGLARTTTDCLALKTYPGEKSIQDRIVIRSTAMNASVDRVLRRFEAGDRADAITELRSRTEPAVDQVDEALVENIALNARQTSTLGTHIASLRTKSQSLLAFLLALSILLATAVTLTMVRVFHRFTGLMEARVTDMEHFSGRVAHDIRSPLANVGLALELTKRDPEMSLRKGVLDRAMHTLQHVGQLVDGLLVFARSGAPPPESISTNAGEVLRSVVDEMRPTAEANGITLSFEKPDPSAVVACSPGVLISITSNLLGNAIKYMGSAPERRIDVRADDVGPSIRFEVRDTGPGLPRDVRERLFDPYARAAESAVPGLGLGLATVRRLVEAHDGTVGVRPNEGPGSLFWFELPKAETKPRRIRHVARRWVPRPRPT